MTRIGLGLGATAAALILSAPIAPAATGPGGRVIVQWMPGAGHGDRVLARRGADVEFRGDLGNRSFQLAGPEPGQTVGDALAALDADPAVALAEPDRVNDSAGVPDDPLFGQLWGLRNTGAGIRGFPAVAGADIDAPGAWLRTVGSPSIVVADIDSGYRFEHPDLAPVAWTNPGEIAGNGLDDDGDGIVDDVHGADFIGSNGQSPVTDGDPTDDDLLTGGHGVHTAGTIGAAGGDGIGITGVAQNARIMPLRVCSRFPSSDDNRCLVSAEVAAINYAAAKGAQIANLSFSGNSTSQATINALAAAKNTLFVIAAGNDRSDNDGGELAPHGHHYPCDYTPQTQASPAVEGAIDNVVCVAATDQADNIAEFSDWGESSVDLGAPGTETLGTYPFPASLEDSFNVDDLASRWSATGKDGGFERVKELGVPTFAVTDKIGPPAPSTEREITSQPFAVASNAGCRLTQYGRIDLSQGDSYELEVLLDGASLGVISPSTTNEPGLEQRVFKLPAGLQAGGQARLVIRFATGSSPAAGSGVLLDDLSLACAEPLGQSSGYGYLEGTSTAAAQVSGTAALLYSMKPDASVTEIRSALLHSVDRTEALDTKTTTGGRLDASRAVDAFDHQAPGAPRLTGTAPASGSNANNPRIRGAAEEFSTVRLYAGHACEGNSIAVGSAEELGSEGIGVAVLDDSVNPLSATATDTAGNRSACSAPLTYVERTRRCRVPNLVGRPLSKARVALRDAFCRLGKVRKGKRRKGHRRPALVVTATMPRRGSTPEDDTVDLRLGPRPKRHRR